MLIRFNKSLHFQLAFACVLGLSSCFDTATLIAGVKYDFFDAKKNEDSFDEKVPLARFKNIRSIAVDSQDNVYVVDLVDNNKYLIRKLTSDGVVTTLDLKRVGPHGFETIAIKDDVLYIPGFDCIYQVDLKQPINQSSLKHYWGTCFPQTKEQEDFYESGPQYFRDLIKFHSDMIITQDNTLYAFAESGDHSRIIFKLAPKQSQAEQIDVNLNISGFGVNSKHIVYIGIIDIMPGHGAPPADNSYIKVRAGSKVLPDIDLFFENMLFDSKDRMYTFNNSEIKRYPLDKDATFLGRVSDYDLKMTLNPSETVLYLASPTAVYRLPLPKD